MKMSPLTLCIGAVQFGLEQHPEARNLLTLQLIQTSPHMVTHQIQLFTETTILKKHTRHPEENNRLNLRSSVYQFKGKLGSFVSENEIGNGHWPWCPLCSLFAVSPWSEGLSPKPLSLLWDTCRSTGQCPERVCMKGKIIHNQLKLN